MVYMYMTKLYIKIIELTSGSIKLFYCYHHTHIMSSTHVINSACSFVANLIYYITVPSFNKV